VKPGGAVIILGWELGKLKKEVIDHPKHLKKKRKKGKKTGLVKEPRDSKMGGGPVSVI